MFTTLVKLAYELDTQGEFEMADKIDEAIKSLAERVGIKLDDLVSLADYFDNMGETTIANYFDDLIKKVAKKEEGKRPRPPKAWFDKMEKEMKKKEPSYSKKMIRETIGELWFDKLSDKEVNKLLKRYKKKK